jgi:hypothetical protein
MADGTAVANPVWQDIQGIFSPFASQMMWRLDLNSYEDVKANAQIILLRIKSPGMIMPPPPFPPLTEGQIQTFANWVKAKCPQTASTGPVSVSAAAPAAAAPPPESPFRFP